MLQPYNRLLLHRNDRNNSRKEHHAEACRPIEIARDDQGRRFRPPWNLFGARNDHRGVLMHLPWLCKSQTTLCLYQRMTSNKDLWLLVHCSVGGGGVHPSGDGETSRAIPVTSSFDFYFVRHTRMYKWMDEKESSK